MTTPTPPRPGSKASGVRMRATRPVTEEEAAVPGFKPKLITAIEELCGLVDELQARIEALENTP